MVCKCNSYSITNPLISGASQATVVTTAYFLFAKRQVFSDFQTREFPSSHIQFQIVVVFVNPEFSSGFTLPLGHMAMLTYLFSTNKNQGCWCCKVIGCDLIACSNVFLANRKHFLLAKKDGVVLWGPKVTGFNFSQIGGWVQFGASALRSYHLQSTVKFRGFPFDWINSLTTF